MCGATAGGLSLDGVDVAKEAVVQGQVVRDGEPVPNAYVRLLDRTGEFTAEVPTSATGHFRFFAGNGEWTLRTLAPRAETVDQQGRGRGRLGRRGDDRALTPSRRKQASRQRRVGANRHGKNAESAQTDGTDAESACDDSAHI